MVRRDGGGAKEVGSSKNLKPLNKSVLREVYPLPKVDETLAQLAGARIFSKLDVNSGFWQIPLSKPSRLLTTFITPTGRYYPLAYPVLQNTSNEG